MVQCNIHRIISHINKQQTLNEGKLRKNDVVSSNLTNLRCPLQCAPITIWIEKVELKTPLCPDWNFERLIPPRMICH
jgi:hypothetical protein